MLLKLSRWFDARRRDKALRAFAIDDTLWQATLDGLPFLAHLDAADLARLRELTSLFIAQKEFSTAHDLELTDRMIVAIAAQASLPVLNLSLDLYRGWVGVVVPPRRWAHFERESLIDPYAADHPSEFFAVCSEALFVQPHAFEAEYPELYRLLARYYRQDPARVGALAPAK
jgi:Mlc titration factor MtfA (ptsG expression regulator)